MGQLIAQAGRNPILEASNLRWQWIGRFVDDIYGQRFRRKLNKCFLQGART